MARPPTEGLTERETQIMEVLWREGAASADRIRQELPDDPHDSTVRTLLRILENKGYVKHSVRGKAFVYRPAVRKASAERKAVLNIIKRFFDGSAEALVLRLIEDERVTPEQLEHLKERASIPQSKHRTGEKS
jgi:predicted transcriptional regulator